MSNGRCFGSLRCDCGEQLSKSLEKIGPIWTWDGDIFASGGSVELGLLIKSRHRLQEEGFDTIDARCSSWVFT